MQTLAERTQELLNLVQDWSLCGAVDYLLENGLAIVEGWHPLKRARMSALRCRCSRLLTSVGIERKHQRRLFRGVHGAALIWWKADGRGYTPWRLEGNTVGLHPLWVLDWSVGPRARLTLPEIVPLLAHSFPEAWVCDLAILLWCADRCYRRS